MATLDPDMSQFRTILNAVPEHMKDPVVYWIEDEMFPYTEEDRLRDQRWCYLYDKYGRGVANFWLEQGCPEKFQWTEIIRTGDGNPPSR